MKTTVELLELLFGNVPDARASAIITGGNPDSIAEAMDTLERISHQEVGKIIRDLREKMARGLKHAHYDLFADFSQLEFYSKPEESLEQMRNALFFSGYAYASGLYHTIAKLLEIAHPQYKLLNGTVPGVIAFERTTSTRFS